MMLYNLKFLNFSGTESSGSEVEDEPDSESESLSWAKQRQKVKQTISKGVSCTIQVKKPEKPQKPDLKVKPPLDSTSDEVHPEKTIMQKSDQRTENTGAKIMLKVQAIDAESKEGDSAQKNIVVHRENNTHTQEQSKTNETVEEDRLSDVISRKGADVLGEKLSSKTSSQQSHSKKAE